MPDEIKDNENNKKILCCNGFAGDKATTALADEIGLSGVVAGAYWMQTNALVNLIATELGEDIPIKEFLPSAKFTVLYACHALSDAMGRKAGAKMHFKAEHQSTIDAYAEAADAIVHS